MPRINSKFAGVTASAGLLSLLAAATPAFAANPSLTLTFESTATSSTNGGISGVKGEATYTFSINSSTNIPEMTLNLKNLSGGSISSSELVSSGFNAPTDPPADSNVTVVTGTGISPWNVSFGGSLSPFGSFDVCTSINSSGDCDASGSPNAGLNNGASADVATFTLSSSPTLATAKDYRDAFAAMFTAPTGSAGTFDGNYFMRFKAINPGGRSDKIWATSITKSPDPQEPPETAVPGPLPLAGLGIAYGFSRNLRRRIKAS